MISELSGRSLDVQGFKRTAGAPVILAHQNGCVTQQWYEDMRGGIRSRLNDFDLSVASEFAHDVIFLQTCVTSYVLIRRTEERRDVHSAAAQGGTRVQEPDLDAQWRQNCQHVQPTNGINLSHVIDAVVTSFVVVLQVVDAQEGAEDCQAMMWQYKDTKNQQWRFPDIWEKYGKKV